MEISGTRGEQVNKQKNNRSRDEDARSELSQDLHNVKESISTAAMHVKDNVKEGASDLINDAQTKTAEYEELLVKYVKENPYKAIGISVLAGLLASALLRR